MARSPKVVLRAEAAAKLRPTCATHALPTSCYAYCLGQGEQRSVSSSSRAVSSSSSRSTDPRVTSLTLVFRLALSALPYNTGTLQWPGTVTEWHLHTSPVVLTLAPSLPIP